MLIAYSIPTVSTIGLTGATWLTADGGAACCDGKPSRKARLQWSAGTALTDYVEISLSLATAATLQVFAVLGSTLPAGVRVAFVAPGGGSLGGDTDNARTQMLPDGAVGVWALGTAASAVPSCAVRIYNDRNGTPWATGSTIIDIGELVAMPAAEVDHGRGWEEGYEDPSERSRGLASQPNTVRRSPYRTYDCPLVAATAAQVRQAGLAGSMDWQRLRQILSGDTRCVAIPRWGSTGDIDTAALNSTALYGTGKITTVRHLGGDWYEGACTFEEIPAQ